MYKKRKNVISKACDEDLMRICSDILELNEDAVLAIAKKFILTNKNELGSEINGVPLIISSIPIKDLFFPSLYRVDKNNNVSYWYEDNETLAKIAYMNMNFFDGKKIHNLYLDLDAEQISKVKNYNHKN